MDSNVNRTRIPRQIGPMGGKLEARHQPIRSRGREGGLASPGQGLCVRAEDRDPGHDALVSDWLVSDALVPYWLVSDVLDADWLFDQRITAFSNQL